ncbi:hypothetical protein ACTJKC_24900 [Pedobacter sp. 22226]
MNNTTTKIIPSVLAFGIIFIIGMLIDYLSRKKALKITEGIDDT